MSKAPSQMHLPIRAQGTNPAEQHRELSSAQRIQLYQPVEGSQIRLLRIHGSAVSESDLVCDLIVEDISLEDDVRLGEDEDEELPIIAYEALSYCWGSPAMSRTIQCNGMQVPVTESLFEALRHIRLSDGPRLLWTDSCCINQTDLAEKAVQVKMMFQIYQRASRVVAWIGTPSIEDELIPRIVDAVDEYDQVETGMQKLGMPLKVDYYMEPGEIDHNRVAAQKAARALITRRPFFQRTWIRQEVFAARKLNIIFGKHAYTFKRFTNVLDQLLPDETTSEDRFAQHDPASRALHSYSYFRMDHDKFYVNSSITLDRIWFHNVMRSSMYQSTLPQDKVFAILGIAAQQSKTAESPYDPNPEHDITKGFPDTDYTKPTSLVYQEFVKHHINVSESLTCLSIFHKRTTQGTDLPSWAVDLRVDTPRYICPQQLASWGITYEDKIPKQRVTGQQGLLPLRGVRMAKIGGQSASKPWAKGYPRAAMGPLSPMLQSCLDANEHWFPTTDGEDEAKLDETFERLQTDCGYTWRTIGEHLAPIIPSERYRWANKTFHYYAFVSELAEEGDTIVHMGGAECAYVIRASDEEKGKWMFLGPALLNVGVFNQKKKAENGEELFEHDMALLEYQDFDWEENSEKFILI